MFGALFKILNTIRWVHLFYRPAGQSINYPKPEGAQFQSRERITNFKC